jgi:membrane associated rhomboid family serine protease
MHPASPYIIAAIVATIVGSYVVVWWRRTSFVVATAAANLVIFLLYFVPGYFLPDSGIYSDVVDNLGFRSQTILDGRQLWGLLTHMYIHAGVLHLAFNMIVLFLMGLPFEDRIGRRNVAIVYLLSGMLGGAVLNAFVELMNGPTIGIGASGAISGIMGAFAVMYPRDRIPMVLGFIIVNRVPVALGALVFLAFETALMFVGFDMAPGTGGNVSHTAHISALAVGVVIGFVMLKAGVEAPTYSSRAKGRMGRLDLEPLRALARGPSLAERFEAMAREDIPEVQEALLEDFVARARCPRCDSILELKGASVRCAKCDLRVDLKASRSKGR